ncbi:TIGR04219 family outer membrane beta-barrel protein [Marinomonas sp. 15G1-11]|uniref:TIGR04219 family outer membrane beta-barrel protein n=1 Tax=Marinomonas phaeophyticola TaxID=3004091 RepID=A0ABT4JQT1_9GAMM|nr:TIGR04219 family outer membrane beta-barrel protein [Marinomonas sp. 15G1-11]MCZ2720600.1 TIGR04219 family outer membrane beta-barrel protein [Marinomonas sp. 15G1-11]
MRAALLLSSLVLASTAQADVLGLTAEIGAFSPDSTVEFSDHGTSSDSTDMDADSSRYYGIAFEHPLPLIPNIRLQGTDLKSEGTVTSSVTFEGQSLSGDAKLDLSHTDYTFYYEFLDGLLWLDLDAGLTLRDFDGSIELDTEKSSLSAVVPMAYLSAYATIPGTSVSVGGELKALSIGDSSITDTTIKVKYETPFLVGIEGGYRSMDIDLIDVDDKDVKSESSGVFIGAFIDF